MPRPRIARLFDSTARLWRPSPGLGPLRERVDQLLEVETFACAVNRPSARIGMSPPGLRNVGERMIYTETTVRLRPLDVIELTSGPEAGLRLEVDEVPTNVRDHHMEQRARIWVGELPTDSSGEGES